MFINCYSFDYCIGHTQSISKNKNNPKSKYFDKKNQVKFQNVVSWFE